MIYLVEDFFSIQGEGPYMGIPSIFLRFGGCNLRCPGFGETWQKGKRVLGCDTVRAVYTRLFKEDWQVVKEAEELIEIIQNYVANLSYRPDIVLTGGEPMLYAEDPIFYRTVEWMVENHYRVTVETNATLAPSFDAYPAYRNVTFAMAVKLSNSGEPKERRIVPEAIASLAKDGKESFFKFTLNAELIERDAYEQISEICDGYENPIYCMPLGESIPKLHEHAKYVVPFCLKHGYYYSDRLHVRLWNREEKR